MTDLKALCKKEVARAYRLANKEFGTKLVPPPIRWSKRMSSTAGEMRYTRTYTNVGRGRQEVLIPTEIRLSEKLLALNGKDFADRTPAHEAAHAIAIEVFGHAGHGRPWKRVMRLLGKSQERCHNYKTAGTGNKFLYKATCGTEVAMSTTRHNRIQRGTIYTVCRTKGKILADGFVKKV